MSLNVNQVRVVAATLRLVEEHLGLVETLLGEGEEGRLFWRERPRLTDDERARVDALIDDARFTLGEVVDKFSLPSERQDASRRIGGILSMSWQSLGEIDAGRLKAYGEVDPRLAETLDPPLGRLMDLIRQLEEVIDQSADGDRRKTRAPSALGPSGV